MSAAVEINPHLVVAITVSQVNHVFALACVFVPALLFHALTTYKLGVSRGNDANHVRKTLLLFTFVTCGVYCMSAARLFADWRGNEEACYYYISALVVLFLMSRQVMLLFLYGRARVVHDALRLQGTRIAYLRKFVVVMATAGVALGFYWAQFVYIHGKVNVEAGVCLMYTTEPIEVAVFAISDALLSIAMLLLFIIPLNSHMRKMMGADANDSGSSKNENGNLATVSDGGVRRMAWNNTKWSITVICIAFVSLVIYAAILATTPIAETDKDYLLEWAFISPSIECWISFLIIHSLTFVWLPFQVPRFCHHRKGATATMVEMDGTNKANSSKASNKVGTTTGPASPNVQSVQIYTLDATEEEGGVEQRA